MTLKLVLLSAALALPAACTPARAQDNVPVAPVVVLALPPAPSDPAIPSGPVPSAVPSTTTPPAAPEVLRLTARPGTYGEYATKVQVLFQLTDMYFEAQPGKTVKAADLAALNAKAGAQRGDMNATLNKAVPSQTGKSFVRVQPTVNGNSVLLTTSVFALPDALHPGKTRFASVGVTLTYDPSGKVVAVAATSDDPQMQKLYQALDLNTLIQTAQQSGSGPLYGQPLVPDQPVTHDTTLDAQRLFQSLLGSVGPVTSQVQARPLVMHVTTTYTGRDAQGRLTFSQALSMEPWNVSMQMSGLDMQFAVTGIRGGGTSVMRPDGLTQTATFDQTMSMQMQTDMPGEPYRMVMKVQYGVSTATTLKKITLP